MSPFVLTTGAHMKVFISSYKSGPIEVATISIYSPSGQALAVGLPYKSEKEAEQAARDMEFVVVSAHAAKVAAERDSKKSTGATAPKQAASTKVTGKSVSRSPVVRR
jgi:hypothetical protein